MEEPIAIPTVSADNIRRRLGVVSPRIKGVGASGYFFDDELHPGLKDKLLTYKEIERPHKIATTG